MKKQFLKSALCLSLSAAVIFSGAGSALAQTAAAGQPDAGPVEVTGLQADVSGIAEEGTQEAEGEAAVAEETEASQTDSEPGDAAALQRMHLQKKIQQMYKKISTRLGLKL